MTLHYSFQYFGTASSCRLPYRRVFFIWARTVNPMRMCFTVNSVWHVWHVGCCFASSRNVLSLYDQYDVLDNIIIIIIIMSRYQHGYPWPSLATPPYRPLLPVGLQEYIPYLHRAAVCRFELVVLPLLSHVKGSTEVLHLWARPYLFSSVPHVWFV